jgi:hypothetical protein
MSGDELAASGIGFTRALRAENRGWAAAMTGELRVEVRKTGRGERARASGTRQIRGCAVSMGGRQGPVDLFLMA